MSSSISLALAAKLNRILSPAGNSGAKFITFIPPIRSLQFKFSELDFFPGGDSETDANMLELNRSNFAEIVNQIPHDNVVYSPSDSGLLWDVFENGVLNNSVTARAVLSEEEKTRLAEAHKFCDENFAVYRSYKNALDQYQLDYKEAKCSLELASGDEKTKLEKEWNEYREKMLLDRIKTAENDLLILGKQNEVTAALGTIGNLEGNKGVSTLKDEIKLKVDALFSKGVPNRAGTDYLYTDFSPLGSFEESSPAWSHVMLYSSEIDTLCRQAPDELKTLFADEAPTIGVESISFEYALVSVIREWFSESLLCSSNWKFALENGVPVSDGKIPATGLIPAYINKILCVRKLSYKQKKTASPGDKIKISIISNSAVKDFNIKKINAVPAAIGTARSFFKQSSRVIRRMSAVAIQTSTSVGTTKVIDRRTVNNKLQLWRKNRIAKFVNPVPVKAIAQPVGEAITEHPFDGIKFIAFECKRLPLSPNPDLTLLWE